MQDFNYVYSNSFEITMELSCCKYPEPSELPGEWELNQKPLLNYIASTHRGVRGMNVSFQPIWVVSVMIVFIFISFLTDRFDCG